MRAVSESSAGRGLLRQLLLPWLAALLMCLVLTWGSTLLIRGETDPGVAVAVAWVSLLAIPVLSSAVAVLLLPASLRERLGVALLAGLPVFVVLGVWRLVASSQLPIGSGTLVLALVLLVLLAAAVAVGISLVARARSNTA